MNRLAGRVAIITGGNTGIGRAVARAYAEEGADVAIAWIAEEGQARSLMGELEKKGRRALAIRTDVTVERDVNALVSSVRETFGRIDVLVNNAGIQKAQPITEMTLDDWDRMMAVHLRGAFLCCREVAPVMMAQKSGRIIILTSQLAYIGRPRYTAYSAAKGGLLTFTRALAQELAPHGVRSAPRRRQACPRRIAAAQAPRDAGGPRGRIRLSRLRREPLLLWSDA